MAGGTAGGRHGALMICTIRLLPLAILFWTIMASALIGTLQYTLQGFEIIPDIPFSYRVEALGMGLEEDQIVVRTSKGNKCRGRKSKRRSCLKMIMLSAS